MKGRSFIDTNILIYAHDLDAGPKHERAAAVMREAWEDELGMLSTQVLQEFYVNITRKIPAPISPSRARGILNNYLAWQIEVNGPNTILHASEIEERYQLSFWDSMIVAAAARGGAERILTEDLNHGQVIEGVRIENPFHNSHQGMGA
ncbi:MAG: PIN domain-containing protein [Acidiferrobacterales bacterium]